MSNLTNQADAAIRHLSATFNRVNLPAKVAEQVLYRQSLGWTGNLIIHFYEGKVGRIQATEFID